MVKTAYKYEEDTYEKLPVNKDGEIYEEGVNGVIHWFTNLESDMQDEGMLVVFTEIFEGWTWATFDTASRSAQSELRSYLRKYGVFIEIRNGLKVADALYNALTSEYHEWTREEVDYQLKNTKSEFISRFRNPITKRAASPILPPTGPALNGTPAPFGGVPRQSPVPPVVPPTPPLPPAQPIPEHRDLPSVYARELGNLVKMYKEEMKYGGGNDSLYMKVLIFADNCRNAGIPPAAYTFATPTMLKGQASDYYYRRIAGQGYDHEGIIHLLREHFETEERRQRFTEEWSNLSLQDVVRKNPDKSLSVCFDILLQDLLTLQGGLSVRYQDDTTAKDRLQLACRTTPVCQMACFKPSATFEGLCADLRNSIATQTRMSELEKAAFHHEDEGGDDDQFYVDREYG